jgi:arabinosyltransferase C
MVFITGSRTRRLILTGVVAAGLGAGATGVALATSGGPATTGTVHTTAKTGSSSALPSPAPSGLPKGAPPKGAAPKGVPKGAPPKGAPPAGAARGAPPGGKPGSTGKHCTNMGIGAARGGSSGPSGSGSS